MISLSPETEAVRALNQLCERRNGLPLQLRLIGTPNRATREELRSRVLRSIPRRLFRSRVTGTCWLEEYEGWIPETGLLYIKPGLRTTVIFHGGYRENEGVMYGKEAVGLVIAATPENGGVYCVVSTWTAEEATEELQAIRAQQKESA